MSAERLASIEETVWTPGEQPALDKSLARSPFDPADDRDRLWTAYLPGVQPQVILAVRYRSRDEDFPPLQRHVQHLIPNGLPDWLYTVDTYRQSRILGKPLPGPEGIGPTGDSLVDEILDPSHGYLLWQFQLESLAQTLGLARQKSIRLRRHVNQKRPEPLRLLKEAPHAEGSFPSGLSLERVIKNRLLYDAALPGQWHAARLLLAAEERHT